jgi:hypothetical protein
VTKICNCLAFRRGSLAVGDHCVRVCVELCMTKRRERGVDLLCHFEVQVKNNMPVHAQVCLSLEWLAAKLCAIMDRTSISKQFLMDVYSELVHVLEMCGYPTCSLNNAPQTSVSKTENQAPPDLPQSDSEQ